jgi:transportin-3
MYVTVIEDFFRLLVDALIYYHRQLFSGSICEPIVSASISALTLQQYAPLTATLHFLRDFLSYGTDNPNSSTFDDGENRSQPRNPPEIQQSVKRIIHSQGEVLVQRILTGMMFHFPRDCFADASGVLLSLFEVLPQETIVWVRGTVGMLPAGSVKAGEADRLMNGIGQHIQTGDLRKVRVQLQGDYIPRPISQLTQRIG